MNLWFRKLSLKCSIDELCNLWYLFSDINSAILMNHQFYFIHQHIKCYNMFIFSYIHFSFFYFLAEWWSICIYIHFSIKFFKNYLCCSYCLFTKQLSVFLVFSHKAILIKLYPTAPSKQLNWRSPYIVKVAHSPYNSHIDKVRSQILVFTLLDLLAVVII